MTKTTTKAVGEKKPDDFSNPKLQLTRYSFPNGITFSIHENGMVDLKTSTGQNQFVFSNSTPERMRQFSKMFAEIAKIAEQKK